MTNNDMTPEQMMGMLTVKMISPLKPDEIASKMQDACVKYNFSILQSFNFYELLDSKGFPIDRKVYVFEICQAKMASKILMTNPVFSVFMPCKIAIYEKDGASEISTINMEPMLKIFEQNKELHTEAVSLFNSIKDLMNSLK